MIKQPRLPCRFQLARALGAAINPAAAKAFRHIKLGVFVRASREALLLSGLKIQAGFRRGTNLWFPPVRDLAKPAGAGVHHVPPPFVKTCVLDIARNSYYK